MNLLLSFILLLFSLGGSDDGHQYKHLIAEGPSMTPTISANDHLLIDTGYYTDHPFIRGDLIVFVAPNENLYVKRVIGLPGERISIENNKLFINGIELDEPYIEEALNKAVERGETFNLDYPSTTVSENSVFVLGDNRPNSYDSRMIGAVKYDDVIGKVIQIFHRETNSN